MNYRAEIKKLREAVEKGDICQRVFNVMASEVFPTICPTAWFAYDYSLDCAKTLHEVVVPEWLVLYIHQSETGLWTVRLQGPVRGFASGECKDNPARAWLIAILKAMEVTE